MWQLILMLQPAIADIPFDLRKAPSTRDPGEIVVTGQRNDRRFRAESLPANPPPPRLSVDLGPLGKADSDVVQGRMGDAQVVIKLTKPF